VSGKGRLGAPEVPATTFRILATHDSELGYLRSRKLTTVKLGVLVGFGVEKPRKL
jgi:hypothetical protein